MGEERAVIHDALAGHEGRVRDVRGYLQCTIGGDHVAHPVVHVRSIPVLAHIDGRTDIGEFFDHVIHLGWSRGQSHRHLTVDPGMDEVAIPVTGYRNGTEVGGYRLVQIE